MPYTYLIGWSHIDKWYYGVRFAKNCKPDDLWVKYFTSSKQVKMYREKYGEPDVIQVRKTFTSTNLARNWETRVIKKINAVLNESWLNKTDNTNKFYHEGLRGKQSKEHLEKLSKSRIGNSNRKGKKFSPESIEKLKIARNKRVVEPMLGKTHKESSKEKMSLAKLGKKKDASYKEMCSNRNLKRYSDPEKRKILSEAIKLSWQKRKQQSIGVQN